MPLTRADAGRYERGLVLAAILAISLLSWAYLVELARPGAAQAPAMPAEHAAMAAWQGGPLLLAMVMWSVMMVAMMLPTATPMILGFVRIQHGRGEPRAGRRRVAAFMLGYLAAWTLFALLAALAQWSLHGLGLMSSAMGASTELLAGGLLLTAGAFQWSGLKTACLNRCRSPLDFLLNEWRDGPAGALMMGLRHGAFCVGCCWALMLLMFAGGVMSLAWMAALALYMLVEKVLPGMAHASRLVGLALAAAGALVLGGALFG